MNLLLNLVFFKDFVDHCFNKFPVELVKLIIVFFKLAVICKLVKIKGFFFLYLFFFYIYF